MLNRASLSLKKAPPVAVPFRFFLTAPFFGVFAGILLAVYGPDVLVSRWSGLALLIGSFMVATVILAVSVGLALG